MMEKNNLPIAIEYTGIEPGIDAIIHGTWENESLKEFTDEKNIFQAEQRQERKKTIIIFVTILICLGAFYWGAKKYSESSSPVEENSGFTKKQSFNDSVKTLYAARRSADSITDLKALVAIKTGSLKPVKHCNFDMLSKKYNYEIFTYSSEGNFNSVIALKIIEKENNQVIKSLEIPSNAEIDCSARSYITGYNMDVEVVDRDYESIIIQDFNFDQREDIAVKTDFGQSGAIYSFYINNPENDYILDRFLSDSIMFLPNLDFKSRTLIITDKVGLSSIERKYIYNSKIGWISQIN